MKNRMLIAQMIQLIFALSAVILYMISYNILDMMVDNFLLASFCIIINIIVLPIIVYVFQNIIISFVKIVYCKRKGLKLKSLDLAFVFIQFDPLHVKLMISSNFLTAGNLTTFYIEDLCKEKSFVEVYDEFLIPFSHLIKIAMVITVIIGMLFLSFKLYYVFVEVLGLALYRIVQMSIDNDYDIINPIISRDGEGYQINLYRQMLVYCRTEKNRDKENIYNQLKKMEYFNDNKYWQYNCKIIIEMIFDSIVDYQCYIYPEDYKFYLSHLNLPVTQGLKLNTIDVLRYFAVYNKLRGNNEVFEEMIKDMRNQVTEIEFGEEPILHWFVKMYWRYVNELEEGRVDLLKDFRHYYYYYFDVFSQKRKVVSQMFNNSNNQ